MVKKIIRFDMYIKTSEQTPTYSYVAKQKVMSNDKDSTQITFNLLDVSPDELSGSSASILLYMQDGSFFQSSDVTIDRNSVIYTMKEEETKHSGNTKVQIVLKKGTVQTASLIYNFEIEKGLEKYPITEVMIQDWTTLTEEAKAFVEQIEGFTLEQFVENKMGQELANLEVNYATRLTGLEQKDNQLTAQLADIENLENYELSSKGRKKQGLFVAFSDDGLVEEYTHMKPIFESRGIPFTLGLVPAWIGTSGFLDVPQIKELIDLGWGISSHSVNHPTTAYSDKFITEMSDEQAEYEIGDAKRQLENMLGVKVDTYCHPGGIYDTRSRMITKKYYRAARCSGYGRWGVNESPIESQELKTVWLDPSAGYLSDNLKAGMTKVDAEAEALRRIKQDIDRAYERDALIIVSTHSRLVIAGNHEQLWADTLDYAKSKMDCVTLSEALNRMGNIVDIGDFTKGHTTAREQEGINFVVGADGVIDGNFTMLPANKISFNTHIRDIPKGVSICPISSSGIVGVAPENSAGIMTTYHVSDSSPVLNRRYFYAVNSQRSYVQHLLGDLTWGSWKHEQSFNILASNAITPSTTYANLPDGYSVCGVSHVNATNAPRQVSGIYKVTKTGGMCYEEYIIDGQIYYRERLENAVGSWKILSGVLPSQNTFDSTTGIDAFTMGTTYSTVSGSGPNGKTGLLVTHRVHETSRGYNYQEFIVFNSTTNERYKRHATGANTWGEWTVDGLLVIGSATRNALKHVNKGAMCFDTSLNKPLWCSASPVLDASGNVTTPSTWVDAAGVTV